MYKWSEFLKGFGPLTNVVNNVRTTTTTAAATNASACTTPTLADAALLRDSHCRVQVRNILTAPWFHGFLTSREAELLLEDQPIGTFLIRFSRSSGGSFALAFVQEHRKILHILSTHTTARPLPRFESNAHH
jgi:hypothetical protein